MAVESGYVEAMAEPVRRLASGNEALIKTILLLCPSAQGLPTYQANLKEGSIVTAGDIIGYLGRTGYSATENTNNIDESHLHFWNTVDF